jgi:phage virion morphogenesis protein
MAGLFNQISGFGRVGVQVVGLDALQGVIRKAILKNSSTQPIMMLIAQKMRVMILSNFDKKRNPDGSEWEPLSPLTVAMRRTGRGIGYPRMLRDTGVLYNSITPQATDKEAVVGTNVPYARKHVYGEDGIPVRNFMWIEDSGVQELINMLNHELIIGAFSRYGI